MTTNIRDPRSVVTPDAFHVSDELLGLPLASPRRRLVAMLIDVVVIGLLSVLVSSWGFLIWGLIGLGVLQLAFRGPPQSLARGNLGRVTGWAYRGSAGCLGIFILFLVGVAYIGARSDFSAEQMEAVLEDFAAAAERSGEDGSIEIEGLEDFARVLREVEAAGESDVQLVVDSTLFAEAGLLSMSALVEALASAEAEVADSVVVSGVTVPRDLWVSTLRARGRRVFAGERIDELEGEIEGRDEEIEEREARIEQLRVELAEAERQAESGLFGVLRDIFDQLGSAFGVWTLYFTVVTTVLRGRTVGKLLTRTRVLRLDGEPMTWLASLERAGGYAAGIATGLLGFLRVLWDRNRQCVHDRIVGTVVVRDGVAAIPGAWREVWTESEETKT